MLNIKTKKKAPPKKIDFPKLMKCKVEDSDLRQRLIVLFNAPETGVVIEPCRGVYATGYWSSIWDMNSFEDFDGEITISNK